MAKIAMGTARPADRPWLIVTDGSWVTRVLKAYSADPDRPSARWFCVVTTPYTTSRGDMGDTYVADVTGIVTFRDPTVPDAALPRHLRGR